MRRLTPDRPPGCAATACALIHRVLAIKPIDAIPPSSLLLGSVFLASKIHEFQARIRDMVNVWHWLLSKTRRLPYNPMAATLDFFYSTKDDIINGELAVLTALGFNVNIDLPYPFMLSYLQALDLSDDPQIAQLAWNYVTDMYVSFWLCLL